MQAPAPDEPQVVTKGPIARSIVLGRWLLDDISQGELARRLKIGRTQLSQWERGVVKPGLDSLQRIAGQLHQPIEWFLVEHPDLERAYTRQRKLQAMAKFGDDADTVFPQDQP